MKHAIIKGISFLVLISLLSFDVSAIGLQEFLQGSGDAQPVSQTAPTPKTNDILESSAVVIDQQLTHLIELVVAGIVASALIISLLVLFLGRMTGNREKKAIKALRIKAEKEKDNITSAAANVREQEKVTTRLLRDMKNQASELSANKTAVEKVGIEIQESSKAVKEKELEFAKASQQVSLNMNKIQSYWDSQLKDTVDTIHKVQHGLDKSLAKVDLDLDTMQRQKEVSQELLQVFLNQHNEQRELVEKNSQFSEEVNQTLQATMKESNQLIDMLKQHQKSAEASLKQFTDELTHYEEQAYEQFDTSFQVADLARQELNANIEESRGHIETMRRHEEQSHTLNMQAQRNLEALDYSKIMKLSNTLDSTQDMFTDIHNKVSDAKSLLNELKDIETDIRKTADNVESNRNYNVLEDAEDFLEETAENNEKNSEAFESEAIDENSDAKLLNENVYKIASGDNAPISFFSSIKRKD